MKKIVSIALLGALMCSPVSSFAIEYMTPGEGGAKNQWVDRPTDLEKKAARIFLGATAAGSAALGCSTLGPFAATACGVLGHEAGQEAARKYYENHEKKWGYAYD